MEGEGERRPPETGGRAVVDGPHEGQRPGAQQLREDHARHQGQAVGQPALHALGVLQQGPHQEGLGGARATGWRARGGGRGEVGGGGRGGGGGGEEEEGRRRNENKEEWNIGN